jgi:hypothetical protein
LTDAPLASSTDIVLMHCITSYTGSIDNVHHINLRVLGGFDWSSQDLGYGGVGLDGRAGRCRRVRTGSVGSGRRIGRCVHRCAHRAARSRRGPYSGSSGGRSPLGQSDHTPQQRHRARCRRPGARVADKHFTDDTTRTRPDQGLSMDPVIGAPWSTRPACSRQQRAPA